MRLAQHSNRFASPLIPRAAWGSVPTDAAGVAPDRAPVPDREEVAPDADTGTDAVTGAFSYSGRAIAGHLLSKGRAVRTLTGHPERAGPQSPIDVRSLDFA